jgi:hypothetical protein
VTAKEYCSTVCKAACCKVRPPFLAPAQCPKLGPDNLCTIYEDRLGFTFTGTTEDGASHPCRCHRIEEILPEMDREMWEKCCYGGSKHLITT